MWIARDRDGQLCLWDICPKRRNGHWGPGAPILQHWLELDSSMFPHLTWEDEPLECDLIATKCMKVCPKCGKRIWYGNDDIHYNSCEQPSSGYADEWEWIECPECKERIEV